MSARSERLLPALDQAHTRQQEALSRLAEQQQRQLQAEQQLVQLRHYRDEYVLPNAGGLTVAELRNRQAFVERIEQAISQQSREVERQQRRLEQERQHWRQAHAREQALDSVVERYRELERAHEDRREQAEHDELRQHPRRRR